jgi:hypothetical protein
LSLPAPMIPRPIMTSIVITGTATDTVAIKAKPWIVRIIRVRRRRSVGKLRTPQAYPL